MVSKRQMEALEKSPHPYNRNAAAFLRHYESMRCPTDVYVIIEDEKVVCMDRNMERFNSYLNSIWTGKHPFVAIVYSKENEQESSRKVA